MPNTKKSVVSSFFRRRKDETNKGKLLRFKKIYRRDRPASPVHCLPGFLNNCLGDSSDAFPAVSLTSVPDDASGPLLASDFSVGPGRAPVSEGLSRCSATHETKLSIAVDIHEREKEDDEQNHNNDDDKNPPIQREDSMSFCSKFLDLIPCNKQNTEHPDKSNRETNGDDFGDNTTRIECILEQANDDEESNEFESNLPSSPNDARHSDGHLLRTAPATMWVQEPLLLVATPRSGMTVRRVRRASQLSYFECPLQGHPEAIKECSIGNDQAIQLPINNGKEDPLHSWVIDFETNLFAGTALFRIRGTKDWTPTQNNKMVLSPHDYFGKYNRNFQMAISGRFKEKVVMTDCFSGLLLDHHLATSSARISSTKLNMNNAQEKGKNENNNKRLRRFNRGKESTDPLPPTWALRAAVKIVRAFSPRVDADLESDHPRILSPLCSAAQTIVVSRREGKSARLYETHAEPSPHDETSLVNDLPNTPVKKANSPAGYVQKRKHVFDHIYAKSLANNSNPHVSPCFDSNAEYTIEFLQHLIDYRDLSMNLGVLGKVKMGGLLRGQPIRYLSMVRQQKNIVASSELHLKMDDFDCLWSFDLWHKNLIPG